MQMKRPPEMGGAFCYKERLGMSYNGSMATQRLATKLFIPPPRTGIVSRPRLIQRLNGGLAKGSRLTLISASAGFGKTTLIGEWIAGCGRPAAWLSLDEGDNDPIRFISYLIAAFQTLALSGIEGIQAGIGEGLLTAIQAHQSPSNEAILTALINEVATVSNDFLFVLDDYHVIDSKPIDETLSFLVEHQPPQMHLIIATREDPSLPLARLRVRGQLTELRAADLRFTPAEAAEFLNQMMGLNLSDGDVASLEARTEGWIAGLQLAALSMQGREDVVSFIQAFTGSHRFVLDYLVEEVLQRQPEHVRSFLLQTSILDRFCAPLCNAVTKREDGKEMLDNLERNNLFLIPLDDKRQWYRYHHLFAEVLQVHLNEAMPEPVPSLHQRASAWYERNGLRPDAIHHALAAKDFEHAADLIEIEGPITENGSIQQTIWLGWVKTLPEGLIHARPVLNVWYAYALLGSGQLEVAESRFKDAERWLDKAHLNPSKEMLVTDQAQFKSLPATIAIGRAYIAQAVGNIPDAIKYASQVLELVPDGDNFRHAQASMMLGMTHWTSGNLQAAERVFADYTMKLRAAGNIPDAIGSTTVLAEIRLALGTLHDAIDTVGQCLSFVMAQGELYPFDIADLHRELSRLYLEQGNLDVAAHHIQLGRELGEKAQLPVLRYRLCIDYARFKKTLADLDDALALLGEAERLYVRSPLPDFSPIPAMKARIWIAQGRLTEALNWAREQGLSVDDDLSYLHEFEHVTLARVLITQYQKERTEATIQSVARFLDRLLQAAQEGERISSVIEILILQSLAYRAKGDIASALVSLEHALALAEPEGYIRIFVDEGEPMAELLIQVKNEKGRMKEYIQKLLTAFGKQNGHERASLGIDPLVEPLSEHELAVLKLLKTEMSGPEIARNRIVSLNTIRTHTQHIYAKLGVNNRRAAVRRAEELGLL